MNITDRLTPETDAVRGVDGLVGYDHARRLEQRLGAAVEALEAQKDTLDEWYQPAPDSMTQPIRDARAKIVKALAAVKGGQG